MRLLRKKNYMGEQPRVTSGGEGGGEGVGRRARRIGERGWEGKGIGGVGREGEQEVWRWGEGWGWREGGGGREVRV